MNPFDKFFKQYAWKFPKGYPDMKNEQDILLLESLVSKILGEEIVLEKALAWPDLSDASRKYYRLGVIDDKIKRGNPFKLEDGREEVLTYTDEDYSDLFANQKVDDIRRIGGSSINTFPFFKDSQGNNIGFKQISKTKELGGAGGSKAQTTERQERSLIDLINSVEGTKTIISADGSKIEGVVRAEKVEESSAGGTEPYSDVKLVMADGSELLVSAKGPSAPTLGSGGIAGIKLLTKGGANPEILDFVDDFYNDAYAYYKEIIDREGLEGQNLYKNKLVPDVSIKVPEEIITTILRGTPEMGGPVSYYYIGKMDVDGEPEGQTIKIKNGSFIPLDTFIKEKTGKLYAHIRKRDGDLYFTRATQNINDRTVPVIFSKKADGSGGAQSRFGIIDKIRGIEIS
jgi:hypothetical protein